MHEDQSHSAAAYAQCLAVWAAGGAVFILARMAASVAVGDESSTWFAGRWPFLYEGVFILLGVLFNVGWFISARFSPRLARFHFVGLNAATFLGTTLCISLFFTMSRALRQSPGFGGDPQMIYPLVALIMLLTAAFIFTAWGYYRVEFARDADPGRFWFSFLTLCFLAFLFLGLLIFSHRDSAFAATGPLAMTVDLGLALGWIPLHACLIRFVWIPLARRSSGSGR
jgi:hypothetical protein